MTTTQKINLMHEVRLTFVQVVVPIGVGFIYLEETHPHWKHDVKKGFKKSKEFIKSKVHSLKGEKI